MEIKLQKYGRKATREDQRRDRKCETLGER